MHFGTTKQYNTCSISFWCVFFIAWIKDIYNTKTFCSYQQLNVGYIRSLILLYSKSVFVSYFQFVIIINFVARDWYANWNSRKNDSNELICSNFHGKKLYNPIEKQYIPRTVSVFIYSEVGSIETGMLKFHESFQGFFVKWKLNEYFFRYVQVKLAKLKIRIF